MGAKQVWIPLWLLFLLFDSCWGRFMVEKNSLRVTSPDSLKDVYECAIGNFGVPNYGGTLAGIVVHPKANRKACKSFEEFDVSFKPKSGAFPTFVLVDRGGESLSLSLVNRITSTLSLDL